MLLLSVAAVAKGLRHQLSLYELKYEAKNQGFWLQDAQI